MTESPSKNQAIVFRIRLLLQPNPDPASLTLELSFPYRFSDDNWIDQSDWSIEFEWIPVKFFSAIQSRSLFNENIELHLLNFSKICTALIQTKQMHRGQWTREMQYGDARIKTIHSEFTSFVSRETICKQDVLIDLLSPSPSPGIIIWCSLPSIWQFVFFPLSRPSDILLLDKYEICSRMIRKRLRRENTRTHRND